MRDIKVYDLSFRRTARFAPERYEIYNTDDRLVASLELEAGVLTLRMYIPVKFAYRWEISDLNMFHSTERRDNWLKIASEKYLEVVEKYGKKG